MGGRKNSEGKVAEPTKITRLLKWTIESDFAIEIDDDRDDQEIIKDFLNGKLDHIEPNHLTSRLSQNYGVSLDEIRKWQN